LLALVRILVARALSWVVETAAPNRCACCDEALDRTAVFCAPCATTVMSQVGGSESTIAFAQYGGAVAVAIQRLKYRGRPELAAPLGELLRSVAAAHGLRAELVIPVPLHPCRLAERGFNQAGLLAHRICHDLGAKLSTSVLRRCRHTPPQAGLSATERADNVRAAFTINKPWRLQGKRVVLVDDVRTTGATLEACRTRLLAAGAKEVKCLVVAIAEPK